MGKGGRHMTSEVKDDEMAKVLRSPGGSKKSTAQLTKSAKITSLQKS